MQNRKFEHIAAIVLIINVVLSGIAQVSVPIEKEPRHRLKFENKYVRLFKVLIPVGDATLYHTHSNDGVSIRLGNADILDEVLKGEKIEFGLKTGDVAFAARPVTLTHRVINNGTTDFRNIFIEILPAAVGKTIEKEPEPLPGHTVLLDNARIRVYRLILKPGESTQPHMHVRQGIGVSVFDAKVKIIVPGQKPKTAKLKAGDYLWHGASTTHMIKNVGSTVFEAVDVELK